MDFSGKTFAKGTNDILGAARIHKILLNSHTKRIGLIQKPGGFLAENSREILEVMTKKHFLGLLWTIQTITKQA